MHKVCNEILTQLERDGKIKRSSYEFPAKIERTRNLSNMLEDVVDEKFYISNEKAEKLISQLKDLKPQTITANYRRVEKQDTEIAGTLVSTELVSLPGNFGGTNCVCVDGTINEPNVIDTANCIKARYDCGISNFKQDETMVMEVGYLPWGESDKKHQSNTVYSSDDLSPTLSATDYKNPPKFTVPDKPILVGGIGEKNFGTQYRQGNRVYDSNSIAMCLTSQPVGNTGGNSYLYAVNETRPCLTPDRIEKRQNGRRFKEDGEDMFTLTGQDRHGVLQVGNIVDTGNWDNPQRGRIYSPDGCSPSLNCVGGGGLEPKILEERTDKRVLENYRIRKLTPNECWRLMGFSDEVFHLAEQVNSNSQLYKQAGNSIVVDVLVGIIEQIHIVKSRGLDE